MKEFCPVCENKTSLASMEMTPEIVEEMAASEKYEDAVTHEVYLKRIEICKGCPNLIGGMTCSLCGCFIQFRARHSTAHCINSKW